MKLQFMPHNDACGSCSLANNVLFTCTFDAPKKTKTGRFCQFAYMKSYILLCFVSIDECFGLGQKFLYFESKTS